tara:strand:- start:40 stop:294 length:255 start_codon:yes stop_codon:yes gene_type:complete
MTIKILELECTKCGEVVDESFDIDEDMDYEDTYEHKCQECGEIFENDLTYMINSFDEHERIQKHQSKFGRIECPNIPCDCEVLK